jgi:hypothetical protein
MVKNLIIIYSLVLFTLTATGQQLDSSKEAIQDCSGRIKNAETAYQSGFFGQCIRILEESLDSCDLSRKEKEQVLELLAKAYCETGETGKAETTVNILLKKFPHYELREAQNPEMFNRFVKRYEIHPKLIIGVKNTGDWLKHKTMKSYSVLSGLDYSQPFADKGYFFTYYGSAEYEFIKGWSVNIDGMFFYSTFDRYFWKDPGFELIYWETDRFIEFPFYLKKYFYPGENFLLYVSAGYGPFYNYYARGNVTLTYTKDDIITGKDTDFDGYMYNIDMLPLKNQVTGQWNVGAGVGYSLKNLRFFLDVRYLGGTGSVTAPEKSDLIPALKNDFFYIDQEMKINQFEVGLTISYSLLNSVKKIRK